MTIVGWRVCYLLVPLDLPMMSSCCLFSVDTASLHISCNSITWWMVLLEKTSLQRCFQVIHIVIGLINFIVAWSLALMWVEWSLSVVENKISCGVTTIVIPSSWCSYLSIKACQDNQLTFPRLIEFCTLHNCNIWRTPLHIWWVSRKSQRACLIDSISLGHAPQLEEQSISHFQPPIGNDLCINS